MSAQVTSAVIAGSVAFAVALLGLAVNHASSKRDRRRSLYGEAVRAALSWHEMLYRVRRRADSDEATRALVERFHDLQESITYHQAWIGAESRSLERSYARLVKAVKAKTEPLITEAWDADTRTPPGNAEATDQHPNVQVDADLFLKDVRSHLSAQPWSRLMLLRRSRRY